MPTKREEWEDSSEEESKQTKGRDSPEGDSPRKKARRKKRTPIESSDDRTPTPEPDTTTRKPSQSRVFDWGDALSSASLFILNYAIEILQLFAAYVFEVFRFALVLARKPLSLILVGYLLSLLVSHLHSVVSAAIYPTVAVLCHLPVISSLAFCRVPSLPDLAQGVVQRADYPKLVDIQRATFEKLLDDAMGGPSLALEIKKAEMATSDLNTLVKLSHLTSKDRIATTLDTFVDDAKKSGRSLQRFSAKVGGAVDRIIAVNDYALKQIEEAASSRPSLWRAILSPLTFHPSYSRALRSSFGQAMSLLETELHALILAAEASLLDLDNLEEQLKLVHSMVAREDDQVSTSKAELLANLWTILGGNRAALRRYDNHLHLLGNLNSYRVKALALVVGALQTLQEMSADLEALRERVSQPVLVAPSEDIPLEVHVKSIRAGLERLTEGRTKAKRLQQEGRSAKLIESFVNP